MGKKENVMIGYYEKAANFAGLINGWLFGGREGILPRQVESAEGRYTAGSDRGRAMRLRSRYRDVVKRVEGIQMRLLIGVEFQTYIDYAMPVRVLDYDAAAYGRQIKELRERHREAKDLMEKEFLSGMGKKERLSPVLTLVLYLGEEKWDAAEDIHSLLDLSEVPQELRACVENYSVHVLDVRHTPDERLREFPEEIACMFLMLKYQKDKEKFGRILRDSGLFRSVSWELCETMWNYTGKEIFLEMKEQTEDEKGEVDMFEAIDEMIEDGRIEGRAEGEQRTGRLTLLLLKEKRYGDLERMAKDSEYRRELFLHYGI